MNALRHVILGLFFFVTLILLGIVTIYLGGFTSLKESQDLVAYFDEIDTLGAGDPVYVYGYPGGRVTDISFTGPDAPPEKRLKVSFRLWHLVQLRKDYEIAIGSSNFLGGRQIDLAVGVGEPLPPSAYADLRGRADANLVRQVTGLLGENRADLHRIMDGLADIVEDVNKGKRALADILLEKQAHADLNAAIAAGRSILAKADGNEGSIGKALSSPELHDRAVDFLRNGGTLFADAKEQPGVIHALIYDEQLKTKLKDGVEGLSDAAARIGRGEGLIGKATSKDSEETWNDFKAIAADAHALLADTRAGKGAVGKLFSDPETEQQLVNITNKFSAIATDVGVVVDGARRGRGVLGLLLTDDQARRTVEHIIDQVARTIEDAREAAPVSSVASFLFGNL